MQVNNGVRRVVLGVSYDGRTFEGWQTQPHRNTVQDCLAGAVEVINGAPVELVCAGRTDTGVHARQQVVHFDTEQNRPLSAWQKGLRAHLPPSVTVQGAMEQGLDFHARFSAQKRVYRYYFYTARSASPLKPHMTWIHYPLCLEAMREASVCLLGTHDFSAFRAAQCQAKSPIRTLDRLELHQCSDHAYVELEGNAFLHHMVRNMMGCLFEVGLGNRPVEWVQQVLQERSRKNAARTYPAQGLTLWTVKYPEQYAIHTLFDSIFPFESV